MSKKAYLATIELEVDEDGANGVSAWLRGLVNGRMSANVRRVTAYELAVLPSHVKVGECAVCGAIHPPCSLCGGRTRCPPDEPGEPFAHCDRCNAEIASTA